MELSDKQLVENFLQGNDSAFPHLVKRYLKPIYNFLYQLAGDPSVLDDLAQETFIKLWKNMPRFDQSRSFKVWIFAIAKNTAYDFLKKKKTVPFSYFTDENGNNNLENIKEEKILPDELLEREDFAKELEEKLKKIPQHYRMILFMHYKNDLALLEIADILNLPYNTVKSQHQRALAALKIAFLGE